jgi:hypothetical protein
MFKEEVLTETAPKLRNNNLRRRTKQTVKKEMEKKPAIHMGYGACSVSGCNCQSYMGSADTCQNCGHNYGLHW